MQYQLVKYSGGVLLADTGATSNAAIIRNADGSSNVTTSYMSGLSNSGGTQLGVSVIAASTTLTTATTQVAANATSGAITATLPPASASIGQLYHIAKSDVSANHITVAPQGTDGYFGTSSLTTQGANVIVWTDGVNWYAK